MTSYSKEVLLTLWSSSFGIKNKDNINEHFVYFLIEETRRKKKYVFIKQIGLCGDFQPFLLFPPFKKNALSMLYMCLF